MCGGAPTQWNCSQAIERPYGARRPIVGADYTPRADVTNPSWMKHAKVGMIGPPVRGCVYMKITRLFRCRPLSRALPEAGDVDVAATALSLYNQLAGLAAATRDACEPAFVPCAGALSW